MPQWNEVQLRTRIMAAAMFGYFNKDSIGYTQSGARGQDFGPPPNVPANTDCSGFATWCYKVAGARDPNGLQFKWIGWTGTLVKGGSKVSKAQLRAGDLIFYGGSKSAPRHVTIYVGYNKCVSHGSSPGPLLLDWNYETPIDMRSYL